MSGNIDPTTRLGFTNKKWGICGFTSSLSAMYDLNQGVRGQVINGSSGYRILAEIKIYLEMLKAPPRLSQSPARPGRLADIRDFTRSFGPPYDKFEIDEYIARIDRGRRHAYAEPGLRDDLGRRIVAPDSDCGRCLEDTKVSDARLKVLTRLKSLYSFDLGFTPATGAGFTPFRHTGSWQP